MALRWQNIGLCFVNYFQSLFIASTPNTLANLETLLPPCIFVKENKSLTTVRTQDKIWNSFFSMASNKAPGPLFLSHFSISIIGTSLGVM